MIKFSPGTPDSSTTKTGRHDIAGILMNTINQIKSIKSNIFTMNVSGEGYSSNASFPLLNELSTLLANSGNIENMFHGFTSFCYNSCTCIVLQASIFHPSDGMK